jgi:hypothetical protein
MSETINIPVTQVQSDPEAVSNFALAAYIKVQNGQTIEHPVMPDNLLQVFGKIPDEYEPFMRLSEEHQTPLKMYEMWDDSVHPYTKVNGVWTDVLARRPMTAQERNMKEEQLKVQYRQMLEKMMQFLEGKKSSTTVVDEIEFWNTHIQKINTWVFDDLENPKFPAVPALIRRDENGVIVSANSSGSTPDVIG